LDPGKGKIKWDALVWDFVAPGCFVMNPMNEDVTILENGDWVVVFGSWTNIEAFDRKTGTNGFRFAAGSW